MAWPSPQDYSEAVQNPRTAFYDLELQQGSPQLNRLGLPRPRSGSFATVYKILSGTRNWAVRCFLHPVSDQQERYGEISAHLAKIRLPYLVQFNFLTQGIKVPKQVCPILKMEWVEGEPLIPYIEKNLGNRNALLALAGRWFEMVQALRESSIAHGDLQHGNVLVVNGELRLVDYDGMFVPSLTGKSSHELGQRNYQHPQRTESDYGPDLDNFASWVVYISLVALAVQPQLWRQFRGGDECLLFRRADFENPESSAILRALENSQDDNLRSAAAYFRPLLDLGPQDVPSLDGRVVIPQRVAPKVLPGGSWIADYLKQEPKSTTSSELTAGEPEPNPSWIQDFIAPPISESEQKGFQNSVARERIALTFSLSALAVVSICVYFRTLTLMALSWAPLVTLLFNYVIWSHRFRLEPAVAALNQVKRDLKSMGDKIEPARAIIKSRQVDRKTLHERYTFDQTRARKDLEAIRSNEKREIEGVQTPFQLERSSIDGRRRELNQHEAAELQSIANGLGSQVNRLSRRIADLGQAESAELAAALVAQQNQYVISYLLNHHVHDASIRGIGPGFKTRLRLAGILSAADVDHRIYSVKGVGSARSTALKTWQQALKASAQQKMPKMLPVVEADTIKGKYASQRQTLQSQKIVAEQQVRETEASVRTKYKRLREPLQAEESAAAQRMQSKLEITQKKYKEQYDSSESIRKKIEEEFKRSAAEIDEKINKERKDLSTLRWKQEKVRHGLRAFANITFSIYLRRVVGLH